MDYTTLQTYRILRNEEERYVDLLDVLVGFHKWQALTRQTPRGSYRVALPFLPVHASELYQMQLCREDMGNLIRLGLHSYWKQLSLESSALDKLVDVLVSAFVSRTAMEISWHTFNNVMEQSMV